MNNSTQSFGRDDCWTDKRLRIRRHLPLSQRPVIWLYMAYCVAIFNSLSLCLSLFYFTTYLGWFVGGTWDRAIHKTKRFDDGRTRKTQFFTVVVFLNPNVTTFFSSCFLVVFDVCFSQLLVWVFLCVRCAYLMGTKFKHYSKRFSLVLFSHNKTRYTSVQKQSVKQKVIFQMFSWCWLGHPTR